MPIDPPDLEGAGADQPDAASSGSRAKVPPPLERSRFGGTQRRPERPDEAPVSRSDLSKGPEELLEHRTSRTNWQVLVISSLVILAFSVWAILTPGQARVGMKAISPAG